MAIQLQDLDRHIAQLQREISSLPKHIGAIEKTLESHLRKLEADRAALAANQRERRSLEDDIQTSQQRISKLRDQMLQAKTNEQYAAFAHEIEFCEKDIHKAEDRILDRMAESETLEQNVKAAETSLGQEKQQVESEKRAARARTAEDQQRMQLLRADREKVAAAMSPQIFAAYERIRRTRKGIAVAEALDGGCSACHMALRLQFFQELRISERVLFCESCGRIMYFNPPVEIEDLGSAPNPNPEAQPIEDVR